MSELAEQRAATAQRSRARSTAAYAVLLLSTLLLLLSAFAVWVDRVALNTGVFVDTSAELIEDDQIRRAVAQRAVDELYASVDVKAVLEEELPDNAQRLAGPASAGLRQAAPEILDRALRQPALQRLWAASIRQSHQRLVDILEEEGELVTTERGIVTLDLRLIVLEGAERLGIRSEVEARLPAEAGRIEVLRSDELDTAQDGFQLLKTLAWLLPLLTLAAFGLAVGLAPDKRRVIRSIGIAVAVVGVLGLVAANLVGNYVVGSLASDTETRDAAGNAWDIVTEALRSTFRWLIAIGALFVVATWLAGAGRRAVAVRRVLAPALRERAWAYAGLGAVALILLVAGASTDFTRFLVLVVLVALGAVWIESMRGLTLHEFPDASGPVVLDEARAQLDRWWQTARSAAAARATRPATPAGATPAGTDLTSRLVALADLHARGELTDEEYASAKARVLSGD